MYIIYPSSIWIFKKCLLSRLSHRAQNPIANLFWCLKKPFRNLKKTASSLIFWIHAIRWHHKIGVFLNFCLYSTGITSFTPPLSSLRSIK